MSTSEKQLAQRIRELRRRHFGARGKAEFAKKLDIPLVDYERYERGELPAGELMVRMCELTGEDLQWLLTGAASRGAVVISGARNRHRKLLTDIARELDARPQLAAPLEAFFDLLVHGHALQKGERLSLPNPDVLIPVFNPRSWPDSPPDPNGPNCGRATLALPDSGALASSVRATLALSEPGEDSEIAAIGEAALIRIPGDKQTPREFIHCPNIARCFPLAFGVRIDDDAMAPMFNAGDVAIVAPGAEPRLGAPALCKFADRADDRCRVWLGDVGDHVHLGRVANGECERVPRESLRWSLEVIYRAARAA